MSEDLLYLSVQENWKLISNEILVALGSRVKEQSIDAFLAELKESSPELYSLLNKYFDELYIFKDLIKSNFKGGKHIDVQAQKQTLRKIMNDINSTITLELHKSHLIK